MPRARRPRSSSSTCAASVRQPPAQPGSPAQIRSRSTLMLLSAYRLIPEPSGGGSAVGSLPERLERLISASADALAAVLDESGGYQPRVTATRGSDER